MAAIQQHVRNVWHSHCISSPKGKKNIEDTEKADVLLWQPHFSGSWKEDSKSLSSHQSLICLHLKQGNEGAKTCFEGKVNIWHHNDAGLIEQTEVFKSLVFSHCSSLSSLNVFLFVMHFDSELAASLYIR